MSTTKNPSSELPQTRRDEKTIGGERWFVYFPDAAYNILYCRPPNGVGGDSMATFFYDDVEEHANGDDLRLKHEGARVGSVDPSTMSPAVTAALTALVD